MSSSKVKKSIARFNFQKFERKNSDIKRMTTQKSHKPFSRKTLLFQALKLEDY
jgi:hypothetical protein